MEKKTFDIIRFDDKLVYHGSYYLSPRAIKTICYLVARYVEPEVDNVLPTKLVVPIKELAQAILDGTNTKIYKSIYQEVDGICSELTSSQIRFNSKVEVRGVKLRGYINWCSSAIPIQDENGNASIQLSFDPMIAQFFLGLSRYVRLYRPELNRLQSGHSIRMFQMLKGLRNKMEKYEKVSVETYEVEQLKFLLGVDGKYSQFKDFNKRIIKPAIKEINEKTTLRIIDVISHRKNRRITSLEFHFMDQEPHEAFRKPKAKPKRNFENFVPTAIDLAELTWAKRNAYDTLIDYGVKEGIALKQLIPSIKGSEFIGFEDYFVNHAMTYFRNQADIQNAGTFVKWWHEKKVFDLDSNIWAVICEKVVTEKKKMQRDKPDVYENRRQAASMTESEFRQWYKEKNN